MMDTFIATLAGMITVSIVGLIYLAVCFDKPQEFDHG